MTPRASPNHQCYAITAPGVELLAAGELERLGIKHQGTEPGGVSFRATTAQLYAANLQLRTVNRLVVRLASFHASAFHELERQARRVPWAELIAPGAELLVRVTARKSRLYHQRAVAERVANAVMSTVAGVHLADRDDDDEEEPLEAAVVSTPTLLLVRLVRDECTISLDSSGILLHRRGYRLATAKAPLRETLAAAMILGAGWDERSPLLDPMCGSGTIPIEAAMLARRIPPGRRRRFAFEEWPTFNSAVWASVRDRAESAILPASGATIWGSDRDAGAIEAAVSNAVRADVAADIEFRQAPLSAIRAPGPHGWLITNPPYGLRVGDQAKLRDLFARLGQVVHTRFEGWEIALLMSGDDLVRHTQLALTSRLRTRNGGLSVRLLTRSAPSSGFLDSSRSGV